MGLRVGFMGTPDFALAALKALDESAHKVACVYSQPPRPKGRGKKVQKSPVHDYAEGRGIPVLTPEHLKSVEAQAEFAAHDLDVAIVAAYGLILPKAILEAPKYGCLNIHASLLPRWRGASPIQQAIWAGDSETGIAIMQMDEGLDTGPVIAKESVAISNQTTASTLHDELAALGGRMIAAALGRLEQAGGLEAVAQDDSQTTYAPLLKKEDGQVDWSQSAVEIDRQIRALNPWPGVYTMFEGQRVKILESEPIGHPEREAEGSGRDREMSQPDPSSQAPQDDGFPKPGRILDRDGHVACGGESVLKLLKIQPAGAKAMDFIAAVNGGYVLVGKVFS